MTKTRVLTVASGGALAAGILSLAVVSKGCGDQSTSTGTEKVTSALGQPSPNQVPLDPTTVPMFVNQLPILPTFAPTVITSGGKVIRNEYTITDSEVAVQMLPPGFPATNVLAMGGAIIGGGTFQGSPSAVFNNTRGIPTVMHWRTNITAPSFMPVDPTLHWANPQPIEKPTPPFTLFPPGYANAQFPVAHCDPHPRPDGPAADGRHRRGVVHQRAVSGRELRDRGLHDAERPTRDPAFLSRSRDG